MRKLVLKGVFSLFLLACSSNLQAQPAEASELINQVYQLNNQFRYVESQERIHGFIDKYEKQSAENCYYAYLALSYTYKRQFDYTSTLKCLQQALEQGLKTRNPDYFLHNIQAEQAMALFDINKYEKADSLMKRLSSMGYQDIDDENKSKIFMQEGYIFQLDGNYRQAEKKYYDAIAVMSRASICDLPMIYGKLMLLYGRMRHVPGIEKAYERSLFYSDSCQILKYTAYSHHSASKGFSFAGDLEKAYFSLSVYDSTNDIYEEQQQLSRMYDLEQKYELAKVKQDLKITEQALETKNAYVAIAVSALIIFILAGLLYSLWYRQQTLIREKRANEQFTKNLLLGIEDERRRIASELHDSIGHELLLLKHQVKDKDIERDIVNTIAHLRSISRDLHPVMFESIGLQPSVEQLAERIWEVKGLWVEAEISYHSKLPPKVELQLYRIVQEALTNTLKYAGAVAAKVSIRSVNEGVEVRVEDNGTGFDVEAALKSEHSFGLQSIKCRSAAIGGKASIKSGPNGTVINIRI